MIAVSSTYRIIAQTEGNNYDGNMSRWVADVNLFGGGFKQNMTIANTTHDYLNGVNLNIGKPVFKKGATFGSDAQLGYFLGQKRHWGIGTGLTYMRQWGNINMGNFHVEYQSTDYEGDIFRQLVSANNFTERIKVDNFNIPLVLKYRNRFSKHWGVAADAGILFNVGVKNQYITSALFNYEAIYAFTHNSEGSLISVYDNLPTPLSTDWLITQSHFIKNNQDGSVQDYFNSLRTQGYNVGLGIKPKSTTGSVSYASGSVGFLFQPLFNYFLSDKVALNFGGYYLYQPFNNSVSEGYMLTNKIGDYNSVVKTISHTDNYSYGLNVGVRFFLGKEYAAPVYVTWLMPVAPSLCDASDGSIILHGLASGKNITVNYTRNNIPQPPYAATSDDSGRIKISGLREGAYTGFYTKIVNSRSKAITFDTTAILINPSMSITSENAENPSAFGLCDGTITLNGLYPGQNMIVNYNYNGMPQPSFTYTVLQDNCVKLKGLCEGTYTRISAAMGNCIAVGTDITLTAPPPPPPAALQPTPEKINISTPILFEINKTHILKSAYPILQEAVVELNENKNARIIIDGHCDTTGPVQFNNVLSLKRANAVKKELILMGADPHRIIGSGHGSRMPAATNKTHEGRRKNRRAVMNIEPAK